MVFHITFISHLHPFVLLVFSHFPIPSHFEISKLQFVVDGLPFDFQQLLSLSFYFIFPKFIMLQLKLLIDFKYLNFFPCTPFDSSSPLSKIVTFVPTFINANLSKAYMVLSSSKTKASIAYQVVWVLHLGPCHN
jgi:hypothetical protein